MSDYETTVRRVERAAGRLKLLEESLNNAKK